MPAGQSHSKQPEAQAGAAAGPA